MLVVVRRDLTRCVPAPGLSLRAALEGWTDLAPILTALSRAAGWRDGSCFLYHGRLIERAFKTPPIEDFETVPLVYQGGSDDLLGPAGPVPFGSKDHQIDCEGEFGVVTDDVPMGVTEDAVAARIRLVVQMNDWSRRRFAPYEMRRAFGDRVQMAARAEDGSEPFGAMDHRVARA